MGHHVRHQSAMRGTTSICGGLFCVDDRIHVEPLEETERSALCRMLEESADATRYERGLFRRRSADTTLVAHFPDVIVGMITGPLRADFNSSGVFGEFAPPPGRHGLLARVHVSDQIRGRGVGRALVHAFAEEALACECTFLGGHVDGTSNVAVRRAFFQDCGFRLIQESFGASPEDVAHATHR